jgi:hypothetical protein
MDTGWLLAQLSARTESDPSPLRCAFGRLDQMFGRRPTDHGAQTCKPANSLFDLT